MSTLIDIEKLIMDHKICRSTAEFKRLLLGGGLSLNIGNTTKLYIGDKHVVKDVTPKTLSAALGVIQTQAKTIKFLHDREMKRTHFEDTCRLNTDPACS